MAKILIIEDESKIAALMKKGLEMQQYKVNLASNGKDGVDKALSKNYDLIILDIMLPELGGMEVARSLRQNNVQTPIIMVTARDSAEDRAAGFEAGANDYLIKPFAFKELIARVKFLLKEKTNTKIFASDENQENPAIKKEIKKKQNTSLNIIKNTYTGKNASPFDKMDISEINKRILDNAPISIITINKEGFITSANKYYLFFSKTKDYRNHNIFNSKFFIRENLVQDYKKLLTDGIEVRREKCYEKNSKGEDKYMNLIAVPLRDKDGKIEGALSMAMDNTEAVLFKNQLQELNKNLDMKIKQKTAELKEANKKLGDVLDLKVQFMADVSHELRTSLTIIQGNLELMNPNASGKENNIEESGQIFNEIKRMSGMLADLSLLANSDSAVQKLDYKKIDLNKLILSAVKSLEVVAKEKNIAIEHKNNKTEIAITADKSKLEKLIMNLIRNAIRYNKDNGWIKIWTEKGENEIILTVEDSGIGIPQKHLPRIFERFYRVNKNKSRNEGGTGLGLAICKWVVEAHGGKINVESTVGQGSAFKVILPRQPAK